MGIDYATLGLGWDHPDCRLAYREAKHPSMLVAPSRSRAEESRRSLIEAAAAVAGGESDGESVVVAAFLREIGVQCASAAATFGGVAAALAAELVLPLRALNEGIPSMCTTYSGNPVPIEPLEAVVEGLTAAVISTAGGFSDWRYGSDAG